MILSWMLAFIFHQKHSFVDKSHTQFYIYIQSSISTEESEVHGAANACLTIDVSASLSHCSTVHGYVMFTEAWREEVDELTLVQECCPRTSLLGSSGLYPVKSGDHSRNSWYARCGRDLLAVRCSHQRPQLSSGSGGPDTACSSGNCWRSPARSDVPTSPCREAIRHQWPGAALGWLVRSSG